MPEAANSGRDRVTGRHAARVREFTDGVRGPTPTLESHRRSAADFGARFSEVVAS